MNRALLRFIAVLCALLCSEVYAGEFTAEYTAPAALKGRDIPDLHLRAKELAAYIALQIGTRPEDTVYLVFDCHSEYTPHDQMYVYTPGRKEYPKPRIIRGQHDDGPGVTFKTLRFDATVGVARVEYDIDVAVRSLWDKRKVEVTPTIVCRYDDPAVKKKCRFVLHGILWPVLSAHIDIEAVKVLQKPTLKVRWDHRSDPPNVYCRVLMGRLDFTPSGGFESRADLKLLKDDGALRSKMRFDVEPSGRRAEFVCEAGEKLKPGKLYRAEVTVDLDPYFGPVTGTATTVLRQ